jgi:branched-chain amino acid transport system ATP-binding protein
VAYLTVTGVSKHFGGLRALDDCTFAIEKLRTSCIVGPNGAGKTSVFNAITGFLRPNVGRIAFKGDNITMLPRRERVRRGIARTFQDLRLFNEMTAIDNVMVCLGDEAANDPLTAIFRPLLTQAALKRKAEAARAYLTQVGLAHSAYKAAGSLSYGQRKLLCIARILATGAELLLLDEPTSGLSAGALDNMVDMIHQLKSAGKTLLVVEHNTRIVQQIADDVLFMHQGHVLRHGTPQEIIADPELGRIYFGEQV